MGSFEIAAAKISYFHIGYSLLVSETGMPLRYDPLRVCIEPQPHVMILTH
jgi:hypothetical protein